MMQLGADMAKFETFLNDGFTGSNASVESSLSERF